MKVKRNYSNSQMYSQNLHLRTHPSDKTKQMLKDFSKRLKSSFFPPKNINTVIYIIKLKIKIKTKNKKTQRKIITPSVQTKSENHRTLLTPKTLFPRGGGRRNMLTERDFFVKNSSISDFCGIFRSYFQEYPLVTHSLLRVYPFRL